MAVDVTTGPGAGDRAGSPEVHAGCVELAGGGTGGGVFSATIPTCNGKESTDETRSCNRGAGAGRDGGRRGPAVDDDGNRTLQGPQDLESRRRGRMGLHLRGRGRR